MDSSMKRKWFRAVSIFVTSVFIWTNCIYASGAAIYYSEIAKDKLAVQSKLEDVFLGAQLMYTGDTALEKALVNNIGGIDDLYRNIARLREDFMKVEGIPGEWKNRVMWLVFNDRSDFKKKAYYIFTPAGIYFRYTNYPDVKDEFYSVLQKYAEKYGDTEQVKVNGSGFFREKYKLAGINLDFINKVLREIYGIEEEIKTKGEHVGPSYLADKLEDCNIKPINGTEYEGLIQDAILRMKGIYPDLGSALGYLLNKNKIKIVETKNGEDMYFIYLNLFRKMRYNLIASLDDTIYIPKGLIKLFLNPERLKEELECYLGKDLYNKLAGGRSGDELKNWLKRCIIGGFVHEVYEVQEYIKDKDRYDRKKVHPSANEKERIIAGISPFDGESAFDDVTKFLILKELKLKPDIMIFDILRDRLRDNEDVQNYGLGFERCGLRNIENKLVKDKLEKLFGEPTGKDDAYHLVIFRGRVIAFSKVRSDGTEIVYNIYNDEATLKESGYPISTIVRDYEYIVKRSKKPISERLALTYEELREYHKEWLKRKEGFEEMPDGEERGKLMEELKRDGIFFAGGKGFSLSLMDDVVDVPPGVTISSTAYFSFIAKNPKLPELIDEKLRTLDTMDDRARQVAAKEIRDAIIKAPISEETKEEILFMYRHLNIIRSLQGKPTPAATGIRSSGISEDMEISTWLPISTGSQAGQADTYLNVVGDESILEKVRADWASLFTDRAISYRDDSVFLIFSSVMGIDDNERKKNYYQLLNKLRVYGYNDLADILTNFRNPGSYNLLKAINEILEKEPENEFLSIYKKALEEAREDFINPLRLGIGVVMMQMVKSYISGVGFNVNPPTRYGGKSRALWYAWHGDKGLVHVDEDGNIIGTKPLVVSYELNFGYGETVVGGMVEPDKFLLATVDGLHWFILEKRKGSKQVQMIDIEESFRRLSKRINEDEIRILSLMLRKAISYDEVSKYIESILVSYLNIKYLRQDSEERGGIDTETDKDKKKKLEKRMMEKIARLISEKIKSGMDKDVIISIIKGKFSVTEERHGYGIGMDIINELVDKLYTEVEEAKRDKELGREELNNYFKSKQKADIFIQMVREVWTGQKDKELTKEERDTILAHLNQDDMIFKNLTYLLRALIDNRFTTLMLTSVNHQRAFTLIDDELHYIAEMIAKISNSYHDDRDVEFAIEIDPSAPQGKRITVVNMLEVDGRISGKVYARLYNVQARPYTAPVADIDLTVERTEIDEDFVEKNRLKPRVNGTKGENACAGFIFKFDPNKDVAAQAEKIKRMKSGDLTDEEAEAIKEAGLDPSRYISKDGEKPEQVLPIIILLEEADPSHDPLMRLCDAVITLRGGETSHAAIFCREQGIPGIAGVGKLDVEHGYWLVADANNGRVYDLSEKWLEYYKQNGEFPINKIKFIVRPYLIPYEEGDTRIGYIMAAEKTAQEVSPTMLAPDSAGIALARAEFKGEEIGINVIAGYGYDLIQKIKKNEIKEEGLDGFQKDIINKLRKHPWIIDKITQKLVSEGYSSFSDYVRKKFYYFYNNLGFSLAPDQINKSRAYDFAQDKVTGLIGSEIFSWPGCNPLVGLRGTSLEIKDVVDGEGGYQYILSFILESLIDANQNTKNQGWFYVFIRTPRELRMLSEIIKKIGKRKGHLPREIGIMIEVPSNAIFIDEFGEILLGLKDDCEKMGIGFDKIFYSFGTNDYSHLAGMGDRDDPRMKLKIQDPAAKSAIPRVKELGYFYVDNPGFLPLIDEGSDVMLQLIEAVVKSAKGKHITTSLCGEAITQLLSRKNYVAAGRIMRLLDSFGISMIQKRLSAAMLRYDVMRRSERIVETGVELFTLDKKNEDTGAVKGEIVFVNEPNDIISDELKGLTGKDLEKRLKYLKYNEPKKLSRVGGKIVVITSKFGSIEEFERAGIPWDHLQYAKAIIIDSDVDYSGWDIFNPDRSIIASRIKAEVKGISGRRNELEGKEATVDYVSGKVYKGYLRTEKIEPELRALPVPEEEPQVNVINTVKEDANSVYKSIMFNPLILLAYRDGKMDEFKPRLVEDLTQLVEEAKKIQSIEDAGERKWSMRQYSSRLKKYYENEEFLLEGFIDKIEECLLSKIVISDDTFLRKDKIEEFANKYIDNLKNEIGGILKGKTVEEYIKEKFTEHIMGTAKGVDADTLVIHTLTSLNCRQLASLRGGFLTEFINPNPDYGLLGAARALSDYWEINRIELEAFKEARKTYKNLGLQITDLRGTQSGAVLVLMMEVLKEIGLMPGQDGLEVGVNVSTPSDTLSITRYIEEAGITFVTIDRRKLGGAWLGADIYWEEEQLVTEEEIEKVTVGPIKIIKKAVKDSGIRLLNLSSREDYKAQRMESHLLPLYLYMKVKEELDYNDAQMMAISYTDREGVIKIDENAASVMGTVLSRELKRNISKDKVIEVLQAHEEIEKAIMDLGIDFTGLRQGLIEYLDIVRDDWDENFKNVVGEGNGQDRLVRLLEAFLRNYPAYRLRLDELSEVTSQIVIIKEILVNQIIERMFFRQGVKVLPIGYKDAGLERIELPEGFQKILGNYLINWSKLRDRNCHYVKLSEIVSGIDPNNEELVKRLTKEVLGERLRYVNKDVNYAIAITKGDLEKRDTLIWQLQVVRDKIRDIVRITQNPVTITLELDDIDHVRDAISLLRSLGFEADNNLRFGLTIKGKGANRELINEANPIGITTLVPYEDGITEIAESSFILLLLDILYSEDLRGMDILIPYESLRAHARETQRIRGIEFVKRLFPGKEVYIKEGWVALRKLLPNQTHVARFKIDAEKVRFERGIYEPIIVIDMIDSDNFLIVDGHHRAKAAAELDRRYCPACIVTAEPPFISKDFKNIIDTNIRSGLSHLGNLGVVDVKARILDEIKKTNIWEAWFTAGGELINETVLNEGIFNSEIKDRLGILKKKIMEVADRFGFGILCGVDRIRLVDNIMPKGMEKEGDLVPYSMIKEENGERILLLDKDALKDEDVLYLVLLHEFREALLTIVEPKDKALRELTGIYLSAKDALKEGIKDVGDLSNLDPDSQFLKVIEQLEGKRDEEIIAVIIEFMRSISYYREFFEGPVRFDFSGDWQREMLIEIEKGIDRYQAALNVFNRIAEAKGIVTKVKVSEEKMAEEQKKKGPIERKGLKDIYKAFSELLDWYSKNTSEVFFIDTKWQGIAVRRLNGEVMSNIDLNDKYQPLWRLFKSKGINSVAISNEVFSKVKDSANRFINLIDDILFSASETDFIGYAHINDLTVKVTPDDGGKRVVITNRLDRKAEDILDWLLTEGITKASELTNTFEKIIAESPKEENRTMVIKADIDTLAEDNIREIRSLSKKQYADGRPMFSFYYYSSSSRDVMQYLEVKGLRQGNLGNINADDMITLIEPQRLRDIRDKKELESRYYLPMFYVKGSIYMAAHVVLLKGDIEGLRDSGALGIINVFLKELLGHHPTDEEIGMFLLNPLGLPDIESVLIKLNNLPLIIKMTTMSA